MNARVTALIVLVHAMWGCGIPRPVIEGSLSDDSAGRGPKAVLDPELRGGPDRAAVQGLIDATDAILNGPRFQANMHEIAAVVGELWLSPYGDTLPSHETLIAYLGIDPRHRPVAAKVKLGDETGTTVAETNIARSSIELGRSTLRRWHAQSRISKSCAVNTLAHELTHMVPLRPGECLFRDGNREWATTRGRPLVSYTVGAVAQCTYLQQVEPAAAQDLLACVKHWGINIARPDGCD